ncbi:MAG: hypothetical protein HQL52_04505 [Magnetococcales bacterium]|nr:hypothetical protein [Magnetococcales bacterium]
MNTIRSIFYCQTIKLIVQFQVNPAQAIGQMMRAVAKKVCFRAGGIRKLPEKQTFSLLFLCLDQKWETTGDTKKNQFFFAFSEKKSLECVVNMQH